MSSLPVFRRNELEGQVGLTITIQELDRVRGPLDQDCIKSLRRMAVGSIRHGSKIKRTKREIKEWVKNHWPVEAPSSYLLGIPDTLVDLILRGVLHFSQDPLPRMG
jgi:hypothetical protein